MLNSATDSRSRQHLPIVFLWASAFSTILVHGLAADEQPVRHRKVSGPAPAHVAAAVPINIRNARQVFWIGGVQIAWTNASTPHDPVLGDEIGEDHETGMVRIDDASFEGLLNGNGTTHELTDRLLAISHDRIESLDRICCLTDGQSENSNSRAVVTRGESSCVSKTCGASIGQSRSRTTICRPC
jgi:hypothetical protein